MTRHPGSVLTEQRGHLSPPAPVPSGPSRGKGCSQPGSGIAPERGCRVLPGACWSWKWQPVLGGEKKLPPGHPQSSRAGERYPEGMPGAGREEDVTRRQLKVQAPGKLEQLQHSPSTGSWQDRQSEQPAGTAWAGSTPGENPKIHWDEAGAAVAGVGSKAGSEHVPEAQPSCIQNKAPLSRHGFSREATAGNWLRDLATTAALPGSLSSRLIWAQLSLLSLAPTSIGFFN